VPPSPSDASGVAPPGSTTPLTAPTAPTDGVDLAVGQTDEYLATSAERDAAAARVTVLATALAHAHAEVVWYADQRRSIQMSTAIAQAGVDLAQRSTDDVVRDLYQQGDSGLGALATILAAGPDDFIDRADNARMATSTAYGVVDRTIVARRELAFAVATQQAFEARVLLAGNSERTAQATLDQARMQLAGLDARLVVLDIAAPQVAIGPDGCPTADVPATLRDGAETFGAAALCRSAVRQAATPQAALALTWAFQHLGAAYACKGIGRMGPWRADCSSLVSRAYYSGAGIGTAGDTWAPSTRNMVPWDGVALDPHYVAVAPAALRPGDLVLYDTCPQGGCPYKHVAMYVGSPDGGKTRWMLHTNSCGDVAKVTSFWGFPTTGHPFLVARRVIVLPGEQLRTVAPAAERLAAQLAARQATFAVRRVGASVPG
jgi:cell wall-associated NlpC family hydrolase